MGYAGWWVVCFFLVSAELGFSSLEGFEGGDGVIYDRGLGFRSMGERVSVCQRSQNPTQHSQCGASFLVSV